MPAVPSPADMGGAATFAADAEIPSAWNARQLFDLARDAVVRHREALGMCLVLLVLVLALWGPVRGVVLGIVSAATGPKPDGSVESAPADPATLRARQREAMARRERDLRAATTARAQESLARKRVEREAKETKDLAADPSSAAARRVSGQRATAEVLMDEMGWTLDKFSLAAEIKAAEQSQALCDGNIDAFFYTVGHPSGAIKEATTSCDSVLVNVDNAATQKLIDENPYYRKAVIPGGMYRGSDDDVTTFGVAATFVSSTDVPDDVVYAVVKAVFENFDSFKRLHPAFANLNKEEMVSDALSAPLHPGAAKYYKEAGLID